MPDLMPAAARRPALSNQGANPDGRLQLCHALPFRLHTSCLPDVWLTGVAGMFLGTRKKHRKGDRYERRKADYGKI